MNIDKKIDKYIPRFTEILGLMPAGFYKTLCDRDKCVFVILSLDSQICNGGFSQYILNSDGRLFPQAFEIAHRIESHHLKKILQEVLCTIPEINTSLALPWSERNKVLLPAVRLHKQFLQMQSDLYDDIREDVFTKMDAYCEKLP